MNYGAVLKNRDFLKVWVSQILSQVAANLLNFALIIQVYNAAEGTRFANAAVSLLVLAVGLPSIFFASAAGTWIDHWNRKWVMVISNALRAGLVLLFLPFLGNLTVILVLAFVISAITQFFIPAEAAVLPKVVPRKLFLTANSLFVVTIYAAFIAGYGLAAPVIKFFGEAGPYVVTGAMFFVATLTVIALPSQRPDRADGHTKRPSVIKELKETYRLVRSNRWLTTALGQLALTQAIVSIILTLAPAISAALLKLPLQESSHYLILPAGIGLIAGISLVSHLTKRWEKVRVMEIGLVVAGLCIIGLGLSGQLYRLHGNYALSTQTISVIVAVLVFTLGALNAIISSVAQTVLQENSTDDVRGKVFGSLNMLTQLAATAPILLTGILADLLSVTKVILIIGTLTFIFAVYQLKSTKRLHG